MAVGRGLDEHHRREMVEVWHPEVAMSQAEIDEYLSGPWVARLATIGRDGYPHVYPFWYYWDGENIYLTPTRKRGSYKDLESNP
ncbi:MAG TPA: pyridoxamine 5'-phosphate oxidase family protein [Candidatus Binataceae bacterium]|nr:pyridoxamine 5'-phosphate oxidase family protein [Candidatus Binataceae bacterium]